MIPKEEAMNGTPLSPEDSEAINDALSFPKGHGQDI
jgi:hypothetical protein